MSDIEGMKRAAVASERELDRALDALEQEIDRDEHLDAAEAALDSALSDGVIDDREASELSRMLEAVGIEAEPDADAIREAIERGRAEAGAGRYPRQLKIQYLVHEVSFRYTAASQTLKQLHEAYQNAIRNLV